MRRSRWAIGALALLVTGAGLSIAWSTWSATPRHGSEDRLAVDAYRQGVEELRRYRFVAAVEALRTAVERDPSFAIAHLDLGLALRLLGDEGRSRAAVGRADSLATAGIGVTALEALRIGHEASLLAKDEPRAAHYYDLLQRDHADDPYAMEVRALRAQKEGRPETAESIYRELLAAHPERVDVHNAIGYLALEQGHYEDAVASFQRYVYYAGDSANPHDSLGEAYLWTGRYHESWKEYLRALEIDPTYVSSATGACDALALTGQFRRALELLDTTAQVFEERGQRATLEVKRLQVIHAAERWSEVLARAERLLGDPEFVADANPGHELWVETLRTIALAELGEFARATQARTEVETRVESLLEQIPSTALDAREDLQLLRSSVRTRVAVLTGQDVVDALAEMRGLLETSTRRPHRLLAFRGLLVEALVDAGLFREAIDAARDILVFNPRYPGANLALARAHLQLRDRENAIAHLQTYLEMMHLADADAPDVQLAQRMVKKLVPSS